MIIPETKNEKAVYDECMLILKDTPLIQNNCNAIVIDPRAMHYMTILNEERSRPSRRPKR